MRQKAIDKISDEQFIEFVKESSSLREIRLKVGYRSRSNYVYKLLHKKIDKLGIDISHLKYPIVYNLEDVLIVNSTYNTQTLKKRIIKEKLLEYKCNNCDNKGEWRGKELILQLDHKNGINNDNRLENLRFLCPNCHSQTDTFSGKNLKSK